MRRCSRNSGSARHLSGLRIQCEKFHSKFAQWNDKLRVFLDKFASCARNCEFSREIQRVRSQFGKLRANFPEFVLNFKSACGIAKWPLQIVDLSTKYSGLVQNSRVCASNLQFRAPSGQTAASNRGFAHRIFGSRAELPSLRVKSAVSRAGFIDCAHSRPFDPCESRI